MIRNKSGATEWTIGKLLSLILLVIFLVLVIWGVTTGGLNPLIQKAEGKFNEVLILFHIKDGGNTNLKCVTYQNMGIDGVNEKSGAKAFGDFTQCVNECNITYKNPIGNYGISAFKIASGGGTFPDGCHFQILIGKEIYCEDKYIINIKEAKEAKAAYLALKNLVSNLETKYGQSFDDFMKSDERSIELDTNKKYFFDGVYWSIDGNKIAEESFRIEVIDYYGKWGGLSVEWGREGDEKKYLPVSEVLVTDIVPKRERVSKDEFKIWFLEKLKEGKILEFDAGDGMSYIYTNGNWATSGGTEKWSDEEVLDSIFNFYDNGKVVLWNYQNEDKKYLPVSNVQIATDTEKNKREDSHALGSWLVKKRDEWKTSFSNTENYKEVLNSVFSSGEVTVNLGTKKYKVNEINQITGKDGSIMPLIFFVDGNYQYGIYYDTVVKDYVLAGYNEGNAEQSGFGVSPYDKFIRLDDKIWEDIELDALINNFFHTKC